METKKLIAETNDLVKDKVYPKIAGLTLGDVSQYDMESPMAMFSFDNSKVSYLYDNFMDFADFVVAHPEKYNVDASEQELIKRWEEMIITIMGDHFIDPNFEMISRDEVMHFADCCFRNGMQEFPQDRQMIAYRMHMSRLIVFLNNDVSEAWFELLMELNKGRFSENVNVMNDEARLKVNEEDYIDCHRSNRFHLVSFQEFFSRKLLNHLEHNEQEGVLSMYDWVFPSEEMLEKAITLKTDATSSEHLDIMRDALILFRHRHELPFTIQMLLCSAFMPCNNQGYASHDRYGSIGPCNKFEVEVKGEKFVTYASGAMEENLITGDYKIIDTAPDTTGRFYTHEMIRHALNIYQMLFNDQLQRAE